MSQEEQKSICPVCGDQSVLRVARVSDALIRYDCERCGRFDLDEVLADLVVKPWADISYLVSAWVRRQNNSGQIPIVGKNAKTMADAGSPEWWSSQFENMGFPETINEKLNSLLLTYIDSVKGNYSKHFSAYQISAISQVAARNITEIIGLAGLLEQLGYLRSEGDFGHYSISANGWLYAEKLRSNESFDSSAFIAMWFDDVTQEYRRAVVAAINSCGYKPVIVDQEQFNGFSMDQVTFLIRQSRLVVADFTSRPEMMVNGEVKNGVRGGVYWEAGMAYGLGKPVIHTCEENSDAKARIHFDVDQYNTIFWKRDELGTEIRSLDGTIPNPNLTEKLAARILETVGRGNYQPEK